MYGYLEQTLEQTLIFILMYINFAFCKACNLQCMQIFIIFIVVVLVNFILLNDLFTIHVKLFVGLNPKFPRKKNPAKYTERNLKRETHQNFPNKVYECLAL